MNPQNHCSIHDWEIYHLINDTQSKFVTAVKRELVKNKVKEKKEVKEPSKGK